VTRNSLITAIFNFLSTPIEVHAYLLHDDSLKLIPNKVDIQPN
jgi:hypothetical protein